eukprot:Gregarina_sp_Poly_1__5821@NODE_3067_length_1410_cov_13_790022_g1944_i0_p1_GENE_NODE_3067_length_1410_cov_13_790022_g1944_i0NODE_3067_length_1410_cov_13_790022_g1944_i0_p1_ORF_typecomplete_len149_score12_93_NODE_3067_length_1410_cov_13_790022_g1944_i08831329
MRITNFCSCAHRRLLYSAMLGLLRNVPSKDKFPGSLENVENRLPKKQSSPTPLPTTANGVHPALPCCFVPSPYYTNLAGLLHLPPMPPYRRLQPATGSNRRNRVMEILGDAKRNLIPKSIGDSFDDLYGLPHDYKFDHASFKYAFGEQ